MGEVKRMPSPADRLTDHLKLLRSSNTLPKSTKTSPRIFKAS